MNILLTRPKHQAQKLTTLLSASGNTPLLFPTLTIEPLSAKTQSKQYDAVIFISKNAVHYGVDYLKNLQYSQLFAVGEATAKKLMSKGLKVDDFPKEQASSEALLALKSINLLRHKNILIFRGKGGMQTLKQGLSANNTVQYIEVYQRIQAPLSRQHRQSLTQFLHHPKGAIIITSIESLSAMIALIREIGPDFVAVIKRYPLLVLSDRIASFAQGVGFRQVKVAAETSNQGLLDII